MQTVILSDQEALAFLKWRKHQGIMDVLITAGVFQTRNGVAELNFDSHGTLTRIDVHQMIFKKQRELSTPVVEIHESDV